jgi:small subunit ribosomal protein S13
MGTNLPGIKKVEYALTHIHGIGIFSARKFIKLAKINSSVRLNALKSEQIRVLRKIIEKSNLRIEGDLRRFNGLNIKRLNDINCYRGKRHRCKLPVRGQRTKTNAKTNKKLRNQIKV